MKYYNLFVTSLIVNAIFALASKQNVVLSSGGIKVVGNLPSDVVDAELVCYDVMPQNISKYKKMTEDCTKINSTKKSCYVKTKSSDKKLFSTVKYRTGRSCDVYTKKEGFTTVKPTYTTPIKKTVPSVASTVLSSGGIKVVGNLPSDVVDAELVCYDVKPQNISKYKKMTEDCTKINSTEKSCYVKTKSADKELFSTVKYRTGRSCDVYTKKEGFTTVTPTYTTTTKTVPSVASTVLSSGGIEVVGNLPSDVVDAELVCYDVKPQNILKYKEMTEDCTEVNSTEKSCYVKTKSADKELFSTVKYRTGRSCDVYTKKEGFTTVTPTYITTTKTVPSVVSTVLSSGGIEVVGDLPSDVIDAELVCYDVKPQNILKYKEMTEDCTEVNSTEKSCYVKTKSADKELFSTVKYRTGRSCDVYTKKEGFTTFIPITKKVTVTKTITV